MINCAKVIACYFGERRDSNNNPNDVLGFVNLVIENEINIKPPINNPEVISRDWFDTDKTKLLLNNDEFFNDIKKHINTYFEKIFF